MVLQLLKLVLGRPVAGISAPSLAMLLSQALLRQTRPPLAGVIACSVRRRRPEVLARPQNQCQQCPAEAIESQDLRELQQARRAGLLAQLAELSVEIAR